MDFLKFYPKGKNLIIEIIPDNYISWQPVKEADIEQKSSELIPIIEQLISYCKTHRMQEIIIIDFDKAIHYDKINYVLLAKLVHNLTVLFPEDGILKSIELRHCSEAVTTIYKSIKRALPSSITNILNVYST